MSTSSPTSTTPEPPPPPRPRAYPDEAGWRRMRPIFTRLYRDEGRTLKECMTIIEADHGFVGTTKMYKNRITEWGLDKRLKRDEVIQMYHMHRTRFAEGKKSEFYIRGRKVDWSSVQRFLKRRPQLRAKYDAGMLELGNADLGIVVRSPSPDPTELHGDVTVLLPMEGGAEIRLPEEIVRITRDFCDGAIDGGIWIPDIEDQNYLDGRGGYPAYLQLQRWYRRLWSIRAMLSGGEVAAAFALLNELLDRLHEVVRIEGLYLMIYIWDFCDILRPRDPQLADVLVRHTAEVMRVVFGPRHPLRLMWDKIESLPSAERSLAITRTMESVIEYIRRMYGPLNINALELTRLYIRKLSLGIRSRDATGGLAEIERRAQRVIEASDDDHVITDMFSRLAISRVAAGRVEEAESALAHVKPWTENPSNQRETCWANIRLQYLVGRANSYVAQGMHEQAGHWFQEAVAHSRENKGPLDPSTIETLEQTALYYRAHGPLAEQARWEQEYKNACREAVDDYRVLIGKEPTFNTTHPSSTAVVTEIGDEAFPPEAAFDPQQIKTEVKQEIPG